MADGYFQVSIPVESRRKLERLARGAKRTMGNVVAVLIAKEDETDPMWNIAGQDPEPSAEPTEDD